MLPLVIFLTLTLTRPAREVGYTLGALGLLLGFGFVFSMSTHLGWWLVSFELLLLVSLYLLRLTSKSERINEATAEMLYWALAGSLALIFATLSSSLTGGLTFEQVL